VNINSENSINIPSGSNYFTSQSRSRLSSNSAKETIEIEDISEINELKDEEEYLPPLKDQSLKRNTFSTSNPIQNERTSEKIRNSIKTPNKTLKLSNRRTFDGFTIPINSENEL